MICVYCAYSEGCEAKTFKDCQLFKEHQQQTEKEMQKTDREIENHLMRIVQSIDRMAKGIKTIEKR